jgi:hypothetical protein
MPEIEANTVIVTRLLNQILLEAALSHVRRIALFLSATLSNAAQQQNFLHKEQQHQGESL